MIGAFSPWHWLLVLLVVVLIFGTKKLAGLGKDLGSAIRGFKQGLNGHDDVAKDELTSAKSLPTSESANQQERF